MRGKRSVLKERAKNIPNLLYVGVGARDSLLLRCHRKHVASRKG